MAVSDDQVHKLLSAALAALGMDEGETIRGDAALLAARRTIGFLQLALIRTKLGGPNDLSDFERYLPESYVPVDRRPG